MLWHHSVKIHKLQLFFFLFTHLQWLTAGGAVIIPVINYTMGIISYFTKQLDHKIKHFSTQCCIFPHCWYFYGYCAIYCFAGKKYSETWYICCDAMTLNQALNCILGELDYVCCQIWHVRLLRHGQCMIMRRRYL